MMQLKDLTMFGRRLKQAGNPDPLQKTEERVVTLGWLCMTATLLVALLLAAYAAI
jgi:hypothetical protein